MLKKDQLFNLISKTLKVPKKTINMTLKLGDIKEWDSLGHFEILIKIDKETKNKAGKIKNVSSCDSIKKIYDTLKKNKLAK